MCGTWNIVRTKFRSSAILLFLIIRTVLHWLLRGFCIPQSLLASWNWNRFYDAHTNIFIQCCFACAIVHWPQMPTTKSAINDYRTISPSFVCTLIGNSISHIAFSWKASAKFTRHRLLSVVPFHCIYSRIMDFWYGKLTIYNAISLIWFALGSNSSHCTLRYETSAHHYETNTHTEWEGEGRRAKWNWLHLIQHLALHPCRECVRLSERIDGWLFS